MEQEYTIGKYIAKGAFSIVKQCTEKKSGTVFAVKMVDKKKCSNPETRALIDNEIAILRLASHPNIVKVIDVFDDPEKIFIVLELVNGGELYEELVSEGPFDETQVYKLFSQLVGAVQHLHDKHVCHRDLKLENILLTTDWKVKLGDFGLSKIGEDKMNQRCGTALYCAPEVLEGKEYDNKVDSWSLGVILYILLHCQFPYNGDEITDIYNKIVAGEPSFPAVTKNPLTSEAKDLILSCLKVDPSSRLSAHQISSHPWMLKHELLLRGRTMADGKS